MANNEDIAKSVLVGTAVGGTAFGISRIPSRPKSIKLRAIQRRARRLEPFGDIGEEILTNPVGTKTTLRIGDKKFFADTFGKDAIATKSLDDVLGKSRTVKGALKKITGFAGEDFLIKPRKGALSNPKSFITSSNISRRSKQFLRSLIGPKKFLVQPRLNIINEFRVSVAAGKVTSVTNRRIGRSAVGAIIPVFGRKRTKLIKFVERAINRSKIQPVKTGFIGFDVAELSRGKFKLIEGNVGPADLINPVKSIKAKTRLLGRLPIKAAIGVSIIAGIVGAVSAAIVTKKPSRRIKFRRIRGRIVPIRIKNG